MIFDILFVIMSWFIEGFANYILPDWQVYPQIVFDAINYFAAAIARFDIILPISGEFGIFAAFLFLIHFLAAMYTIKIFLFVWSLTPFGKKIEV